MEPKQKKEILGMSPTEISILIILIIVIVVIGGFFFKTVIGNSSKRGSQPSSGVKPTYTLFPSVTPSPLPPQSLNPTPIPGWSKFEFSSPPGQIWLPEGYEGGDTIVYPDIVILSTEIFTEDQEFIEDVKNLIALPEVVFFAFDTNSPGVIRFMYIMKEAINPDLDISIDDYMNSVADSATDGARVVGRTIVPMDHYQAGRLVIENKVPAGDVNAFILLTVYSIRLGDTMWNIAFRTGRDEFNEYLPVMDGVANSLLILP